MITNIEQCLHQLIFALKLKGCIESNRIKRTDFDLTLEIDGSNLTFESGTWKTQESIIILSENATNMAIAALAIAADEELDKKLGSKNPERTDFPYNLRAVIYQVRNAFSHSLLTPKYQAKPKYQKVYCLPFLEGEPKFDFIALNGETFDYEHFGGFNNFWETFQKAKILAEKS